MKKIITLTILVFIGCNLLAQKELKILFVGNSYTAVNNLPKIFENVAKSNEKNVYCEMIAPSGARFQTHYNNKDLQSKIINDNFDIMILQGQSQEVAFPYEQFYNEVYPYAKLLDSMFKANNPNGRVIYYMTGGYRYGDAINCQFYSPFCNFWTMSEELCNNYTTMAKDFSSELAPIGKAWQYSIRQDSTIILHQTDNSHPTKEGSLLAAYVLYNTIYKDTISSNNLLNDKEKLLAKTANFVYLNNESLPCNLENYVINSSLNSIKGNTNVSDTEFIIFDTYGRKLNQCNSNTKNEILNALPQGIYIIKGNNSKKVEKFVKIN